MTEKDLKAVEGLEAYRREHGRLRLEAFYFSFEPTGVDAIDRVLSAVATAARRSFHTEGWTRSLDESPAPVEVIQAAANLAAASMRPAPAAPPTIATGNPKPGDRPCPRCKSDQVTFHVVESSCGAFDDKCFDCGACGYRWWVDGPDA